MTEDQKTIVLEALERDDDLTGSEWDFVNRVAEKDTDDPLTQHEAERLHRIGERLGVFS